VDLDVLLCSSGGARPQKFGSSESGRREPALLPSGTDVSEVTLMRAVLIVLGVLAVVAAISLFGLFGIGAPLAAAAIILVPATFMVSLVIGFASRRRSWFG
jgi:hypothetical protein